MPRYPCNKQDSDTGGRGDSELESGIAGSGGALPVRGLVGDGVVSPHSGSGRPGRYTEKPKPKVNISSFLENNRTEKKNWLIFKKSLN